MSATAQVLTFVEAIQESAHTAYEERAIEVIQSFTLTTGCAVTLEGAARHMEAYGNEEIDQDQQDQDIQTLRDIATRWPFVRANTYEFLEETEAL